MPKDYVSEFLAGPIEEPVRARSAPPPKKDYVSEFLAEPEPAQVAAPATGGGAVERFLEEQPVVSKERQRFMEEMTTAAGLAPPRQAEVTTPPSVSEPPAQPAPAGGAPPVVGPVGPATTEILRQRAPATHMVTPAPLEPTITEPRPTGVGRRVGEAVDWMFESGREFSKKFHGLMGEGVIPESMMRAQKEMSEAGEKTLIDSVAGLVELVGMSAAGKLVGGPLKRFADDLASVSDEIRAREAQEVARLLASGASAEAGAQVAMDTLSSLGTELAVMMLTFNALGKFTGLKTPVPSPADSKAKFAAKTLQKAIQFGALKAARTKGTPWERAKVFALTTLYMSTPGLSGLAPNTTLAILGDIGLNVGISLATGQYQRAIKQGYAQARKDGNPDKGLQYAIVNLIPLVGTDFGYAMLTRSRAALNRAQERGIPIEDATRQVLQEAEAARAQGRDRLANIFPDIEPSRATLPGMAQAGLKEPAPSVERPDVAPREPTIPGEPSEVTAGRVAREEVGRPLLSPGERESVQRQAQIGGPVTMERGTRALMIEARARAQKASAPTGGTKAQQDAALAADLQEAMTQGDMIIPVLVRGVEGVPVVVRETPGGATAFAGEREPTKIGVPEKTAAEASAETRVSRSQKMSFNRKVRTNIVAAFGAASPDAVRAAAQRLGVNSKGTVGAVKSRIAQKMRDDPTGALEADIESSRANIDPVEAAKEIGPLLNIPTTRTEYEQRVALGERQVERITAAAEQRGTTIAAIEQARAEYGQRLDAMNKKQLLAEARRQGISVDSDASRTEIQKQIETVSTEGPGSVERVYQEESVLASDVVKNMAPNEARAAAERIGLNSKGTPGAVKERISNAVEQAQVAREMEADRTPNPDERASLMAQEADHAMSTRDANRVGGIMRQIGGKLMGLFRRAGEAHVRDPEMGKALDKAYDRFSTAPQRGVDAAMKKLAGIKRVTEADAAKVATEYETGSRENLENDVQKQMWDAYDDLEKWAVKTQQDAGVLGKPFPQGAIERLNVELEKAKGKEAVQIREQIDALQKIKRYVSHKMVARIVREKFAGSDHVGRVALGDRLEAFHRQRKGTATLQEYIDAGILEQRDANIMTAMMGTAIETYQKVAIKQMLDQGKEAGWLYEGPARPGYISKKDVDPRIQHVLRGYGDNVKIDELLHTGLKQLAGLDPTGLKDIKMLGVGRGLGILDTVLGLGKVGQFYNPALIWTYNIHQRHLFGGQELNPVKSLQNFKDATVEVATRGEQYTEALERNLFQTPSIKPAVSIEDMVNTAAATKMDLRGQMDAWVGKYAKTPGKAVVSAVAMRPLYEAVADVTWTGDKVQRMHTYLNLKRQGFSPDEAAAKAAEMHGAYSKMANTPYQNIAKRIFFVQTFRLLMPLNRLKAFYGPVRLAMEAAKGRKVPMHEVRQATRAFVGQILVPTAIHAMFTANGWEPVEEEKTLPTQKLRTKIPGTEQEIVWAAPNWKYKKEYVDASGETREAVITPNYIANMSTKYLHRGRGLISDEGKPTEFDPRAAAFFSLARWEIHPFYRTIGEIWSNETMFGTEPPRGDDGRDIGRGIEYMYSNMFRIWNETGGAARPKSPAEEKSIEDLNRALGVGERAMFGTKFGRGFMGSAYTRQQRKDFVEYASKQLWREVRSTIAKIERTSANENEYKARATKMLDLYQDRVNDMSKMYDVDRNKIDFSTEIFEPKKKTGGRRRRRR